MNAYRFSNLVGAPYRGGNVAFAGGSAALVSPVGNRISVTELRKSECWTLPVENGGDVSRVAVSPNGALLLSIDASGRCILVSLARRILLHRMSFKAPVTALGFSPDGSLFAVAMGRLLQVWRTPGCRKEFMAFQLLHTFSSSHDTITCLGWSPDGNWIICGCKDFAVRIFTLQSNRPVVLSAHRNVVNGVFFTESTEGGIGAYSFSKDGALCHWVFHPAQELPAPALDGADDQGKSRKRQKEDVALQALEEEGLEESDGLVRKEEGKLPVLRPDKGQWELVKKRLFHQHGRLSACDYHSGLNIVVAGFSSGVFGIYQMPDFTCIHLLSISKEKITTAVFNRTGNWVAFGCAKLGQLLVWDWRSETYILKQQGHYFDVNCVAYSPDSQLIATGADDNKVKLWNAASGFCFVTFAEHTNAVTAVLFLAGSNAVLSASLDGTVRAWDLMRYRNFRTFTTPAPTQFVSLAADQSGEIICAGTLDTFQIYVWSMKTARLVDVLSGHEGPVHGLAFSPTDEFLASSSWDKTVRLWDVFEGKGGVETFTHTHDVLTVVYRPDGKQLACSTLDGQIHFWDPIDGLLMGTIEGRRDVAGGRLMSDRRTAANSSSGKCFTTMSYSADGSLLLAGGTSKYICMYDVADQVLLRRFQISHNYSLDGVLDFLNSKRMTAAGPIDLIDDYDSDNEAGVDGQVRGKLGQGLPGAQTNAARPIIRTKCLRISPTGRSWAAATTEGLLIYSMDNLVFDPTDLDMDVTPEAINDALESKRYSRALLLALRLNEPLLIQKCVEAVDISAISDVVSNVSLSYLGTLIDALAQYLEKTPHLEFLLRWCLELCTVHGRTIQSKNRELMPALKSLLKSIASLQEQLATAASKNDYLLHYLCSAPTKSKSVEQSLDLCS
ncbi:periodic tryptophan protein 2 [Selaginella moellendorffii]|uniref:periodic tryptophan protein 2 n=1 Tax=Selaginella moellendorffii TaxID=88036 RepID=UPI000D1C227F|nr:periodic tryptophan protein 2 [Selaginella moellendorffii]XP_024525040.1 periodic tryptophan protein 2 [Selaginella moellendorffii]|eukprot:XP_024525039.1 periodic tryptophan protein 2 [Selaginella moellendorffii]